MTKKIAVLIPIIVPVLLGIGSYLMVNSERELNSGESHNLKAALNELQNEEEGGPSGKRSPGSTPSLVLGQEDLDDQLLMLEPSSQDSPKNEITNVQLQRYVELSRKVLLSELEKAEIKSISNNESLITGLSPHFEPGADKNGQFAALDLLFDAVSVSPSAENMLAKIAGDPRVDQANLPMSQRQELAGLKAEVLARWIAAEPDRHGELSQINSKGSVSTKIWKNVMRQFEMNEKTSQAAYSSKQPGR